MCHVLTDACVGGDVQLEYYEGFRVKQPPNGGAAGSHAKAKRRKAGRRKRRPAMGSKEEL